MVLGVELASAASFGVTPPYVKNESLARESVFEQKITLVRGNPDSDLKAEVTWEMEDSEANKWISIDRGKEFIMPEGEQKVPMIVRLNVPKDAPFRNYQGKLRVITSPADDSFTQGSVSIALGARIDIDFTVVDKKIYEFDIRRVKIQDLNEYEELYWLTFPGKIKFTMTLANTGNVPVSPDRVEFDIYDIKGNELLEEVENTNRLKKVDPFETADVEAQLPTRLPAGSYLVRYRIYDHEGNEVKQEGETNLSVLPKGTLPGYAGYGFFGLDLFDQTTVFGPMLLLLVFFMFFFREQLFTQRTAFGRVFVRTVSRKRG